MFVMSEVPICAFPRIQVCMLPHLFYNNNIHNVYHLKINHRTVAARCSRHVVGNGCLVRHQRKTDTSYPFPIARTTTSGYAGYDAGCFLFVPQTRRAAARVVCRLITI